ncbi:MAG TPA: methylated-DNA--[protein]-cysteine S-methyltransferase [Patescibacteria group bacterium]|jgi:AraC family transcriptional regulator of adaptative response/methylated-DNA-[protein]-cysteine methyltransferase|nr:methylated-DNA--[protein]-cysteine S-methyltransferase [Patescibacteria group bacterium]
MKMNELWPTLPPRKELERAFAEKDTTYDGVFYVAVKTTGIFCRPSCPSRPNLENVEFFSSVKECLFAGYRACKRCRPLDATGTPPAWVSQLIRKVEEAPDAPLKAGDLRQLGITPERARRWFQQHYGMSFTAWCRGNRLAGAFMRIRQGTSLDDTAFDSGFESHSGFREAFARAFGQAPGRSRKTGERVVVTMLESPLGPMLAGANDQGIVLLEYTDRRMLEHNLKSMRRRFDCGVVPGRHPLLEQLGEELKQYFSGRLKQFQVPLASRGTEFQNRVWDELRRIPYAETISYDELARRIGQPTAQRAVARANGMNHVCILIPCHRVIGKDGSLTGYGGGLWRKRLLLELEKTGRLPGSENGTQSNSVLDSQASAQREAALVLP